MQPYTLNVRLGIPLAQSSYIALPGSVLVSLESLGSLSLREQATGLTFASAPPLGELSPTATERARKVPSSKGASEHPHRLPLKQHPLLNPSHIHIPIALVNNIHRDKRLILPVHDDHAGIASLLYLLFLVLLLR